MAELDVSAPGLPPAGVPAGGVGRVHFGDTEEPVAPERRAREVDEDDKIPFDLWVQQVVNWSQGGFSAIVHRISPQSFMINNRYHRTGGKCGEMHEPPTQDAIRERWGGGSMEVEILGPDPIKGAGLKFHGRRKCQIAADPRPIDAIGADGNVIQLGGASERGGRGGGVGDQVVLAGFKTLENVAVREEQRAERERDRAERTQQSMAPHTEMLVSLARETADGKIEAERVRAQVAERQTVAAEAQTAVLRDELNRLRSQVEAMREDGMGGGEKLVQSVLTDVVRPMLEQKNSNGHASAAASSEVLRQIETQHQRQVDDMRLSHQNSITALTEQYKSLLEQERSGARSRLEQEQTTARSRIEEVRDTHRSEVERVRESERNSAQMQISVLQSQIHQLERREKDLHEELRDWKQRAFVAEGKTGELQARVARLESDLSHAPKTEKGFVDQMKEIALAREAMQGVFGDDRRGRGKGRDDDDEAEPKETALDKVERMLENPLVGGAVQQFMGFVTGESAKERAKEVEIAKENKESLKAQAVLRYTEQLAKQQRKQIAQGGAQQPQRPAQQQQQVRVSSVIPSMDGPVAPSPAQHSLAEQGDRPLPPVPSSRELQPEVVQFKKFLLLAEQAVRNDHSPAVFLELVQEEGVPVVALKAVRAQYEQPAVFLSFLQGNGVFSAFPVFAHPIGRRWVSLLWKALDGLA